METQLEKIARRAKETPNEKLTSLIHLINKENLMWCHKEMAGNKASGIDKVSKRAYGEHLEENIDKLLVKMKRQSYKPLPVRRTYIPKGRDSKRPLGVLAYEDKLVQKATAKILTAIYEPAFMDSSFGYRPGRSPHDATALLDRILNEKRVNYVVDTDIRGFFDNMSHDWIMKFLEHRISDVNLLRLIKRMLKAGIIEDGKRYDSTQGAIQGGSVSPILANIYLHYALDLWFEEVIRKKCEGEAYMVRFADDSVFCFEKEIDALRFYSSLIPRLGKFDLEISKEKTKVVKLNGNDDDEDDGDSSFDFLGFTHYEKRLRYGNTVMRIKTSSKRCNKSIHVMKEWMKNNRTLPVKELMRQLNLKLNGYLNYYAIYGNARKVRFFIDRCRKNLFKWLNRRSQKKSFGWDKFNLFLKKYPLANPRIRVRLEECTV